MTGPPGRKDTDMTDESKALYHVNFTFDGKYFRSEEVFPAKEANDLCDRLRVEHPKLCPGILAEIGNRYVGPCTETICRCLRARVCGFINARWEPAE